MIRPRSTLRSTQNLMSDMVAENDAKLIISGMGSGKTGGTLDGVWRLLNRFEAHHVLVIAPLFVAKNTWVDEIEAWQHTRAMSYAVAVGDPIQRAAAIRKRAEITTINFENLPWLAKFIRTVDNWYWDTVVVDESSRLAAGEGRTKTTKVKQPDGTIKVRQGGNQTRFGVLTTARRKVERVIELTGTPAPQGLISLWGQAYLLDQGEALGRSKDAFEREFFHIDREKHLKEPKAGAEAEILRRLQHLLITIPQEKVTEDAQFIPLKCRLPDDAMEQYRELEKTLYNEKFDVEAVSRGVLANKLMQAANGHWYKEDSSVVKLHEAKYEAYEELRQQCNGESILTFYSFKFDKDELKRRYPKAVIANEYKGDLVADWNKGRIKELFAHPASIGHGTNLQYGGHIACWFGLTFSLELWLQANMRLPRPGQTKQVLIYPIIAEGTYDERAMALMQSKGVTQDRIISNFVNRI